MAEYTSGGRCGFCSKSAPMSGLWGGTCACGGGACDVSRLALGGQYKGQPLCGGCVKEHHTTRSHPYKVTDQTLTGNNGKRLSEAEQVAAAVAGAHKAAWAHSVKASKVSHTQAVTLRQVAPEVLKGVHTAADLKKVTAAAAPVAAAQVAPERKAAAKAAQRTARKAAKTA